MVKRKSTGGGKRENKNQQITWKKNKSAKQDCVRETGRAAVHLTAPKPTSVVLSPCASCVVSLSRGPENAFPTTFLGGDWTP